MWKLLTILAIVVIPLFDTFRLNQNDQNDQNDEIYESKGNDLNEPPRVNITPVSLNDFNILQKLGNGSYANVYLARKNGGVDNGTLYALKAVNLTFALKIEEQILYEDILINERNILEKIKGLKCATGLHYTFRLGKWLFFVIDLATGGNLFSRVIPNPPNWNTMKIVLAEIVCAVEILHSVDVLHGDISLKNTVIDSDGHLLLADFGNSEILSRNNFFNPDWKSLSYICDNLFQSDIIVMFRTMTDEQILELKHHPLFDSIDWEQVASRTNDPPFAPNRIEINQNVPLIDLTKTLEIDIDDETEAIFDERFRSYNYVAPEHQF